MDILVKKYSESGEVPSKTYDSDFCYDVTAVSEEEIAPHVWKYRIGIGMQIKRFWENIENKHGFSTVWASHHSPLLLGIDLRPRSSVWKTGMVLSNCVGTIDEHFTGEISAIFYHVLPDMPRYKVGDKIGQIALSVTAPLTFKEVTEFETTDRGGNGYGSTGR